MTRLALVFALLAAGSGAASAEQFYKWQDETGAWHYTTTPPKGTSATTVHVSGGRARTRPERNAEIDVAAPPRDGTPDSDAEADAPAPNTYAAIAARRTAACDNAQKRLEVLQNNAAVEWDRDGDGVAEPLDVASHAAEIDRAKTDVAIYCKR